jgi:purine-binding chemotaxis protein CheW
VNFHSQIIPTLDLSKRFRHKDTPYSINHVIVILEHNNQSIGVIIESVDTIIEIPESAVLKPIKFDDKTNDVSQDISGEIKVGDEVLMLLNTESLVHSAVQLDSTEDTNPQSSGFNHFSKAEKEVLTSLTRSPNRN